MKKHLKKLPLYLFLIISVLILAFAIWWSYGKYQQKRDIENLKASIRAKSGQTIQGGALPGMPGI